MVLRGDGRKLNRSSPVKPCNSTKASTSHDNHIDRLVFQDELASDQAFVTHVHFPARYGRAIHPVSSVAVIRRGMVRDDEVETLFEV